MRTLGREQHTLHGADDSIVPALRGFDTKRVQTSLWVELFRNTAVTQGHTEDSPVATGAAKHIIRVQRLVRTMKGTYAKMYYSGFESRRFERGFDNVRGQ